MLHHPCILGYPQQKGKNSEVAASPLPCREPKRGRKCYVTPPFSGIPNAKCGEQNEKWSPTKGNEIRYAYLTLAFWGALKRTEPLCHPCILRGPQRQARGAKSEMLSPLLSRGIKKWRKCNVTSAFSGIPNKGEQHQKCLLDPCSLGGPKEDRAAMSPLHAWVSPVPIVEIKITSGRQRRRTKLEVVASPLPSQWPE